MTELLSQQAKAVVVRPSSSIAIHSATELGLLLRPPSSTATTDSGAATQTGGSLDTNDIQTTTSPAVERRSPVDEADDRALFETQPGPDDHSHVRAAVNQSSQGDGSHRRSVRRKRSEESEFDNVDALDLDEERLARVRTDVAW